MTHYFSSAVSTVGKAMRSVASSVLDWNTGAFSGSVDVIVVRNTAPDGTVTFESTPFHVKFGILQVLKSSDRIVSIRINGKPIDLEMKLTHSGFAYFSSSDLWEMESDATMTEGTSCDEDDSQKKPIEPFIKTPKKSLERSVSEEFFKFDNFSASTPNQPRLKRSASCSDYFRLQQKSVHRSQYNLPSEKRVRHRKIQTLECSLCWDSIVALSQETPTPNAASLVSLFRQNSLSEEKLQSDPKILSDPQLCFRLGSKIIPSHVILPSLIRHLLFHSSKPLPESIGNHLSPSIDLNSFPIAIPPPPLSPRKSKFCSSRSEKVQGKSNRVPTSEQLGALPLRPGYNSITFSVTSSLQGTQIIQAAIYLWESDSKIVISDIDGTITKSDVLGFILPTFWNDWIHNGVAQLFRTIEYNGYHILYLTARLISLTQITRNYLFGLRESTGAMLPQGPILSVPFGFITAVQRDHAMKIQILMDVIKVFGESNPFYAGFGNQDTDIISYETIRVPKARIFIINKKGEIIKNTVKQSYTSIYELVDQIFPPIKEGKACSTLKRFYYGSMDAAYGFNYWRAPIKNLEEVEQDDKQMEQNGKQMEEEGKKKVNDVGGDGLQLGDDQKNNAANLAQK